MQNIQDTVRVKLSIHYSVMVPSFSTNIVVSDIMERTDENTQGRLAGEKKMGGITGRDAESISSSWLEAHIHFTE